MTKADCLREADALEQHAQESQAAWLILGQSDKFAAAMDRVRKLRHAATLRTSTERSQYLQ